MALSLANFDYLRTLVQQRSAIVLDDEKTYLAENRLLPLARQQGLPSVDDLVERLRATPSGGLHRQVVESMAINETSFFRDVHPFECLRREVLPALVQRRAGERRLRIWSAACSSGQEPYSVAMLLREHFPDLASWDVRLSASDLSAAILERAREGRYTQVEVNRGLPARLLVACFQKQGGDWQLREEVRRMVKFFPINLIEPWPALGPLDIVLLRNVLIYFDVATKQQILARVRQVLRPDGYLFLGGAETTFNLDPAFERFPSERAGCYRLGRA